MRYIFRHFLNALACVAVFASTNVYAQFQSLHQFPVTYNIGTSMDASGNIYYNKTPQLFGFRDQFAPSGVSGCVMGYPELRTLCQTVDGGFGFTLDGYSSYTEFKVYIPAGTTFFGLSGYMPQSVQYAAAVKLGSAPTRVAMLSAAEYEAAKVAQNRNSDFAKLQAGEERLMVHDGGGSISLSGIARLSTAPLTTGQWLYVRVLNGSSIAGLGALYEVNLDQYRSAYSTTQFGADGDPVTSGGTTPPPTGGTTLTGISLSKSEWMVGTSGPSFIIKPVPETATLPSCTFSPNGVLAYTALLPPSSTMASVSISESAAAQLAQAHAAFTVDCGGKTATFTINQAGTATTATVTEIVETDGTMTLKLTITRPVSEVVAGAKSSYWVGAVIPGSAMFSQQDEWFYLSTGSVANSYDWKQLVVPYPLSVAFAKELDVTAATQEISIPLGFSKAEFAAFQIKVHFGYQMNGGTFRKLDHVWNPAP